MMAINVAMTVYTAIGGVADNEPAACGEENVLCNQLSKNGVAQQSA